MRIKGETASAHGTNVMKRERVKIQDESRKEDGERIRELRTALDLSQEGLAAKCGVTRISISSWESGKSRPSPRHWRQMAKLAGRVAPSTSMWFWEKAGIGREAFEDIFPEFERVTRESENRLREQMETTAADFTIVPVIRTPVRFGKGSVVSLEEIEGYLSLPKQTVLPNARAFALRVSAEFVRPIFDVGDLVVIDPTETNLVQLNGKLVVAGYVADAETRRTADQHSRGLPVADHVRGRWPYLFDGIYLGWLKTDPPVEGTMVRQMNLNSAKRTTDQPVQAGLEFTVPMANIAEPTPGQKVIAEESEATVLGRVICWISGNNATH